MRGPVGSEIIITVVREGEDEPFDVTIIRDFIKLTAARVRTEGKSVVIRVTTFNDNTFDNIKDGLDKELEKAGGLESINGIVIDLRVSQLQCRLYFLNHRLFLTLYLSRL